MVKRICFYYCLFYIVVVHYTRFIIAQQMQEGITWLCLTF